MSNELKYIIYTRKSSEEADRQVQSIDDQVSKLGQLSKDLDIKVVRTYKESKSAKQPGIRPLFSEMLTKIGSMFCIWLVLK